MVLVYSVSVASRVQAECNDSVAGIAAGMNITFFPQKDCAGDTNVEPINYQHSMTGFPMMSFQLSRKFADGEQLDFSTYGRLPTHAVWNCANWTGRYDAGIKPGDNNCYNAPSNGSDCSRLINWNLCVSPLGYEYVCKFMVERLYQPPLTCLI